MGLYDRDYYRDSQQSSRTQMGRAQTGRRRSFFANKSVVFFIIAVNVALYLANGLFFPETNLLTSVLSMHSSTLLRPAWWFETLSYGFVHDPFNPQHILFNMLALFFFGPPIERRIGGGEFFVFYLFAILVGGIFWGAMNLGAGQAGMLGASGAISAVVILFAFCYPNAQVLLFFIIPMPVWIFGIGYVLYSAVAMTNGGGNIAHSVHLAGAIFGAIYALSGLRFMVLGERILRAMGTKRKPTLSVYDPRNDQEKSSPQQDRLAEQVDQILAKISRSGEASLTEAEREILRHASREYQNRMK